MAYKQMPILLVACMATAVAADCQDPNQAVVEVVKGYAASGHIDNYAIEKYGHGDKMAVIVSKKPACLLAMSPLANTLTRSSRFAWLVARWAGRKRMTWQAGEVVKMAS